ncbi:hypothetical protein [Catellatospora sp. NPDC049609]|uniref:hypothetical protein n=1 Tax=Catellatospora sp. NPDC049609 TaxID=3155505 RepID=UPI00343683B6
MVQVANKPMSGSCYAGVKVTVDVELAEQSSLTVAEDFIDARGPHEEHLRADLADPRWVAELTAGALKGARSTLIEYEYRTGPLRVVLLKHYLHIVDSGYGAMQAATSRAVKRAIDMLPHRMVAEWVTHTATGPVVRLTSPVGDDGWRDAAITVEVAPAPERLVSTAPGFDRHPATERLSDADLARVPQLAVAAAHAALDEYEPRVGPLRVTLVSHHAGEAGPRSLDLDYRFGVDAAVRMAVEQLEFALA